MLDCVLPKPDHDPTDFHFSLTSSETRTAIEQGWCSSSPFEEPEQWPHGAGANPPSADDDSHWDVFVPDDDEIDPLPEPGDFWFDND